MPGANYAFMSAYLKSEEAKVVSGDHVDRMMNTPSIQDALATIAGTDIGDYFGEVSVNTFDDLDEYLWRYLAECIARIEAFRLLPGDMFKIMRAYLVKYDVFNIKAALCGIMAGKKVKMIPLGIIYSSGLLRKLSETENIDDIIEVLIKGKLENYGAILGEYRAEQGVKSRLSTEAKLDGEYYKSLLNMTRRVKDGSILAEAFGLLIDLTNLQIASRAIVENIGLGAAESITASGYMLSAEVMRELLPLKLTDVSGRLGNTLYRGVAEEISTSYNRTQSITNIDEIIDRYKFSMVKEILSPRVLSTSVIVWYLIVKELEIRNLRLILKAMFDNVSLEEIKQYLVGLS